MAQAISLGGSSFDRGSGVVGSVEISLDGGATWHLTSPEINLFDHWHYSWIPTTMGTVKVGTRATDDSGNTETPTFTSINVTARQNHALLFYNSSVSASGLHAIAKIGDDGSFTSSPAETAFSSGWTHVAEGGDHFAVFYDSTTGGMDVGRLDHSGVFTDLKADSVCAGWTHVIITPHNYA